MKQKYINIIIGVTSILAFGFALLKVTPFTITADTYVGTIITILSILVTIVIGYQIFNIIEFKQKLEKQIHDNEILSAEILKTKEDVNVMKDELQKQIKQNAAITSMNAHELEAKIYFEKNPDQNCISAFMHYFQALDSALDCDFDNFDYLLHHMRRCLTKMSAHSLSIFGTSKTKDGPYIVASTMLPIHEHIDLVCMNDLKLWTRRIKQHQNYPIIRNELERVLKLFYNRIERIKEDPLALFPEEENERIMNESPW